MSSLNKEQLGQICQEEGIRVLIMVGATTEMLNNFFKFKYLAEYRNIFNTLSIDEVKPGFNPGSCSSMLRFVAMTSVYSEWFCKPNVYVEEKKERKMTF